MAFWELRNFVKYSILQNSNSKNYRIVFIFSSCESLTTFFTHIQKKVQKKFCLCSNQDLKKKTKLRNYTKYSFLKKLNFKLWYLVFWGFFSFLKYLKSEFTRLRCKLHFWALAKWRRLSPKALINRNWR